VLKLAKSVVKNVLDRYPQRICRQEFESQTFTRFNERPIEFAFVFRKLGEIYPHRNHSTAAFDAELRVFGYRNGQRAGLLAVWNAEPALPRYR
jgi:hypothetical protein